MNDSRTLACESQCAFLPHTRAPACAPACAPAQAPAHMPAQVIIILYSLIII